MSRSVRMGGKPGASESMPLLTGRLGSKRSKPANGKNDDEDKYWEDWEDENDPDLLADKKRRGTSLIVNDCCLLLIHTLQLYAMLQSLSLRWVWPQTWLSFSKYVFFINADVWEFSKLSNNVTFKAVQGYYTPSTAMPFPYWYILLSWGVFLTLLLLIYIFIYICIVARKHPYMLVHIAKLQRGYIMILQLLAIPVGVAVARVFHCTDLNVMDIANEFACLKDHHWAFIAPVVVIFVLLFAIFPTWMIIRTKNEMLNMTSDRHEGYLQLKEVEYVQGMDVMWLVNHFHVFSSFKKHGCYFRSINHIIFGIFVILFSALFQYIFAQILVFTLFLLCLLIAYLIIRPYRVRAFNIMLFFSLLVLFFNAMVGAMITTFNAFTVQSIWLTPAYLVIILGLINGTWAVVAVLFVLYLVVRLCGCCGRWNRQPLWPSMTSRSLNKLTPETRTYVKCILRCRVLSERTLTMPAIFAPAHEVARQIHIINAYCREAEYLHDPMQDSLWDVLDELIETHSTIAPKSLFADSVKDSIRRTAGEFMRMMPMFVRRLAQREFDFIMMRPVKRRLLLKLYCMGLFLNGRKDKVERQRLTEPAVQKVWKQKKNSEELEDDGYYEDMYPELEDGPVLRPQTAITLELLVGDDLDDQLALEEAERFTKDHPLTRQDYNNLAFLQEDDLSTIVEDAAEVDVDAMMEGVPSRPNTIPFSDSQGGSHLSLRSATIDLPESHTESRFSLQSSQYPTKDTACSPIGSRPTSAASQRPSSAVSQRPSSAVSKRPSSAVSQRPSSAISPRPSSAVPRPSSGMSQHSGLIPPPPRTSSALSVRSSASGPTSRPTSADSSRTLTPLPGQIMDDDNNESKA